MRGVVEDVGEGGAFVPRVSCDVVGIVPPMLVMENFVDGEVVVVIH